MQAIKVWLLAQYQAYKPVVKSALLAHKLAVGTFVFGVVVGYVLN